MSPFTRMVPLAFLIVTVGILAAGGFFVYTTVMKGGGVNPLAQVTDTVGGMMGTAMMPKVSDKDFSFIDDPLIRKHFAAQVNVGKYRIKSSSDGRGQGASLVELMYAGNDMKYHMRQDDGKNEFLNMIQIGDITYLKDQKDGTWWMEKAKPVPTGTTKDDTKFKPEDFKSDYQSKTKMIYKKIGEEACPSTSSGLTCYKYEETESGNKESGKRTFWFDKNDLLLRKEMSGYGEFTSTTEYSYDGINVAAPSPTKPVPEGKSVYDMMMGGMGAPAM